MSAILIIIIIIIIIRAFVRHTMSASELNLRRQLISSHAAAKSRMVRHSGTGLPRFPGILAIEQRCE